MKRRSMVQHLRGIKNCIRKLRDSKGGKKDEQNVAKND